MQQVNCYLFRGEKGFTVIDTGLYKQEGMDIWESLMALGITIEKVVLTHFHIGFARGFQKKYHVPVFISGLDYEEMKRRRKGDCTDWVINLFQQHDGFGLKGFCQTYIISCPICTNFFVFVQSKRGFFINSIIIRIIYILRIIVDIKVLAKASRQLCQPST